MQRLTLDSKQEELPLEVDTFKGLFSLKPRAEDGRLWEDEDGRFPDDEDRLIREEPLSLL